MALGTWLLEGHGAVFVTLTTRHQRRDDLAGRLEVIASALHACLKGSPWEKRARALGYVGAIRAVEINWWHTNGWHPHCHAVLLLEDPPTVEELRDLETWLYGRWSGVLESRGLGSITRTHGVDVRPVTSGDLGDYLTKVEGGWTAGHELARGDRKGGERSAVELLRRLAETGEARWAALWQEYEAATFGKRALVWSPGLKRRLLGDEGPSDLELAACEGEDTSTLLRAWIEAGYWRGHLRLGTTGDLLTEVENAAATGVFPERDGVRWEVVAGV